MNTFVKSFSEKSKEFHKVKLYRNQDFDVICKILFNNSLLFEDEQFPLELPEPYHTDIEWKRPPDLCKKPILINNLNENFKIKQSVFTPQWLPSLLCVLRLHTGIIDRILINKPQNKEYYDKSGPYLGIYHFKFFIDGNWNSIVIDDRLPIKSGHILFSRSSNSSEFWEPLLEKVLAKILGGYSKLKDINLIDTMSLLTCGLAGNYHLNISEPNQIQIENFKNDMEIFMMYDAFLIVKKTNCEDVSNDFGNKNLNDIFYVVNKMSVAPQKLPSISINKIAFSVLLEPKSTDLIGLRNPTNFQNWKGSFHRSSKDWDNINSTAIDRYDLSFTNNYEFWMPLEDFLKLFEEMYIGFSELIYTWDIKVIRNKWNKTTNFLKDKQYIMNIEGEEDSTIAIILSKIKQSTEIIDENYLNVDFGVKLFKAEKNRQYKVHCVDNVMNVNSIYECITPYNFVLSANICQGTYVIVPWIGNISKPYKYCLKIYMSIPTEIRLLDKSIPLLSPLMACFGLNISLITRVIIKQAYSTSDMSLPTIVSLECENTTLSTNLIVQPPYIWNESFIFYRRKPTKEPINIKLYNVYGIEDVPDKMIGYCIFDSTNSDDGSFLEVTLYNNRNGFKFLTNVKLVLQIIDYQNQQFDEV